MNNLFIGQPSLYLTNVSIARYTEGDLFIGRPNLYLTNYQILQIYQNTTPCNYLNFFRTFQTQNLNKIVILKSRFCYIGKQSICPSLLTEALTKFPHQKGKKIETPAMLNLNDFSFLSEILNLESALSVPSFEFAVFLLLSYENRKNSLSNKSSVVVGIRRSRLSASLHNYYSCFQTPQKSLPESECKKIYIYIYLAKREPSIWIALCIKKKKQKNTLTGTH